VNSSSAIDRLHATILAADTHGKISDQDVCIVIQ